jgi:hypothetical protein
MAKTTDQTVNRFVRLSSTLAVEITFGASGFVCEWDPEMRPLTRKEERRYRLARNAVATEFARVIGGCVVVGDLTRDGTGVSGLWRFYPDGRVEFLRRARG